MWTDALPLWPLVPFYAWLLWRSRGEPWFGAIAWWGGFLALGTFLTNPSPATRYLAPLELAVYFPVAVAAASILVRRSAKTHESTEGMNRPPTVER
jgi:hypothetical protein